jgi:HEPN domain-containing protein
MKGNGDIAQRWLKRAQSDFDAAEVLANNATALEGACFHCQQAAEKALKGWLIQHNIEPPKTHYVEELIDLCAKKEPGFAQFRADAKALTPYAVKLRYDSRFWPSIDEAWATLEKARAIFDFVKSHWN